MVGTQLATKQDSEHHRTSQVPGKQRSYEPRAQSRLWGGGEGKESAKVVQTQGSTQLECGVLRPREVERLERKGHQLLKGLT